MNDRSLCEVIPSFRLVAEFRICHHKDICACNYACALVWKDLVNFTKFVMVILTLKTPQFHSFPHLFPFCLNNKIGLTNLCVLDDIGSTLYMAKITHNFNTRGKMCRIFIMESTCGKLNVL